MYTQGIDPELDFSDMPFLVAAYTRLMGMEIHPRTPYSGKLVFTAFSGSHQDAIRKGMHSGREKRKMNIGLFPILLLTRMTSEESMKV